MAARAIASPFVRDLSEVVLGDLAHLGRKAANLGELTGAGFPIPPGFAIESNAFVAFVEETGLREDLDSTAAEIRTAIETTPIPVELRAAILERYRELQGGCEPAIVAVRSSTAAAAPHGETFLCVRQIEAVLHAVRGCWASLLSPHAIPEHDEPVAVVIQQQIDATRSGVIVTTDRQHDEGLLLVEAAYGLGESVLQGLVSPDVFTVDSETLRILAREVHYKATLIEQAPPDGGTRRRPEIGPQASCPALLDREVRTLATLGKRIEEHYGTPQIVEWALDRDGHAWLLQSGALA